MNTDALVLSLTSNPSSYTILSGQGAIVCDTNYSVRVSLPSHLDASTVASSLCLSLSSGETVITSTSNFVPSADDPHGAAVGSLTVPSSSFAGGTISMVIRDSSQVLLNTEISLVSLTTCSDTSGGGQAGEGCHDAGLAQGLKFSTLSEANLWIAGQHLREDGVRPADMFYGQYLHTQTEGSYILAKASLSSSDTVATAFRPVAFPWPMESWVETTGASSGFAAFKYTSKSATDVTYYGLDYIRSVSEGTPRVYTFTPEATGIARMEDVTRADNEVLSQVDQKISRIQLPTYGEGLVLDVERNEVSLAHDLAAVLADKAYISDDTPLSSIVTILNDLIAASKTQQSQQTQ